MNTNDKNTVSLYANATFYYLESEEDNVNDFVESLELYEDYLENLNENFYKYA